MDARSRGGLRKSYQLSIYLQSIYQHGQCGHCPFVDKECVSVRSFQEDENSAGIGKEDYMLPLNLYFLYMDRGSDILTSHGSRKTSFVWLNTKVSHSKQVIPSFEFLHWLEGSSNTSMIDASGYIKSTTNFIPFQKAIFLDAWQWVIKLGNAWLYPRRFIRTEISEQMRLLKADRSTDESIFLLMRTMTTRCWCTKHFTARQINSRRHKMSTSGNELFQKSQELLFSFLLCSAGLNFLSELMSCEL